jgi:hypothetical protein
MSKMPKQSARSARRIGQLLVVAEAFVCDLMQKSPTQDDIGLLRA